MSDRIIGSNNEPLKVQVITDVHYYSRKLGVEGKAYDKMESKSQIAASLAAGQRHNAQTARS